MQLSLKLSCSELTSSSADRDNVIKITHADYFRYFRLAVQIVYVLKNVTEFRPRASKVKRRNSELFCECDARSQGQDKLRD